MTGLNGSGLTLQDNATNSLPVTANGTFTFGTALTSGSTYAVTIQAQPSSPAQRCVIANGTGSGTATANVTSVSIKCTNTAAVGQFLWSTNPFDENGNGSVAALAIGSGGALTPITDVTYGASPYVSLNNGTTENQPSALAIDPTGAYLYVANSGCATALPCTAQSSTISIDAIQPDGSLQVDASTAITTGIDATNQPDTLITDPTGDYLYVGNVDVTGGLINGYSVLTPSTPAALTNSPYAAGANGPTQLAIDLSDQLVFAANVSDATVTAYNVSSSAPLGSLTATSGTPYTAMNGPYAIAVVPGVGSGAGVLYVTDDSSSTPTSNKLYALSFDASGNITLIASYPVGNSPTGVVVDPTYNFVYVSNSGDGTVSAFQMNSDGSLVAIGSPVMVTGLPSPNTPTAVSIDPSSQYLYVANGDATPTTSPTGTLGCITAFVINADGTLTAVGGSIAAATVQVVAVGGGPSAMAIK